MLGAELTGLVWGVWNIRLLREHGSCGHEDCLKNWARGYWRHNQAKNLASFCPNPENLSAADFKRSGLICLAEEFQDRIVFKLS